jgi:hypothetical protein
MEKAMYNLKTIKLLQIYLIMHLQMIQMLLKFLQVTCNEKDVIKYLQGKWIQPSICSTEEGLYESIPQQVKERFNPDLKRLRELQV